jgi:2'-5' RNA ligase
MTAPIHSIWLMPAAGDDMLLAGLVRGLSQRFGTPPFTPHLTIAGDTDRPVTVLAAAITQVARAIGAFSETVAAIETSEAFFRSFYARFAVVPPLAALKHRLDGQATEAFMPHVSLLYGPVPTGPKAQAAAEVAGTLTGRAIRFDRLCVVTSGQDVPIDQWRIVATATLA